MESNGWGKDLGENGANRETFNNGNNNSHTTTEEQKKQQEQILGTKEIQTAAPCTVTISPPDEKEEDHQDQHCHVEVQEDKQTGLFVGEFDEKGGCLRRRGSDVVLCIPPGAVPKNKTYRIEARIDTNLKAYNHLMKSEDEYIVGPVPEFILVGGGVFEKPVQIEIPVCIPEEKGSQHTRVMVEESENLFKDIKGKVFGDEKKDTMTYTLKDNKILIETDHFTRFVCTSHGDEEVTDAILVVYGGTIVGGKTFVKLRVMLHFKCAGQNDFSGEREEFLDPGMEEVVKQKIVLPVGTVKYPLIETQFVIHDAETSNWGMRVEGGDMLTPQTRSIDGDSLCFSGPNHRSEQLADFCLENPTKETPPMLNCHVTVRLNNVSEDGTKTVLKEKLVVDYQPKAAPRARTISKQCLDETLIMDIAPRLGGEAEFKQLGLNLELKLTDVESRFLPNEENFTRFYRLLDFWKRQQGDNATIERLRLALERTNRNDIVHDVLER